MISVVIPEAIDPSKAPKITDCHSMKHNHPCFFNNLKIHLLKYAYAKKIIELPEDIFLTQTVKHSS